MLLRRLAFGALLAPLLCVSRPDSGALAIQDVTVIPMTGAPPIERATVLIRNDRIAAIGPSSDVDVPDGATIIDGTGRFLIPGLIEMHAHVSKLRASSLGLFVANGVTTLRDMGGEHAELLRWRNEIGQGQRVGPRMLIAGPYLESADNIARMRRDPPEARVEPFERTRIGVGSPEDATRIVDSLAALELDFLKIRTVQDLATYRAINEAAGRHGLKVVGHVLGLTPERVLEAGQDGVEHFFYPVLDDYTREQRMALWRQFSERGIAVVPTLVTFTRSAFPPTDSLRAIVEDSLGAIEAERRYLSRFLVLDWREQVLEADDETRVVLRGLYPSVVRNLREMHEAGVPVLAGSDVAVLNIFPGSSLHEELELFVSELGMSPHDALAAATVRSAEFLGIQDSVGTIEVGNVADLALLGANPLEDISSLARVEAVVLRGRLLDRAALDRVLEEVLRAPDVRVNDWKR